MAGEKAGGEEPPQDNWLSRRLGRLVALSRAFPLAALALAFAAGVIFWGGFNWTLELANTESFCISCHVMRENIYKDFRKTVHFANRTGVRATCPDCHVPRKWSRKVARKVAATNELFHWLAGTIDSPEKFAARRPALARHVWRNMEKSNSRECRNCHDLASMAAARQKPMASRVHGLARGWNLTCIKCHQGIAHILPESFDKDAVLDDLHARIEKEKIKCWTCHKGMARAPEDRDQ